VGAPDDTRLFLMLGDPFSTPTDDVLLAFNTAYNGIPIVGGMASGALRQYGNALILNDQITNMGAVGISLSGPFDIDVIVSQGCRPIWQPFTITSAHKNTIFSLDNKPPLDLIQDLIMELSEEERNLLQNGLFVGRAVRGTKDSLGRGDFLIRGVMGVDRENGAISIADSVMEGELIQFHLRDALTAQEDLEMMLVPQMFCEPPSGALLFTCNGRGTRLYDHADGDISIIRKNLGVNHLAGFFCAGEIGPIGRENYMHGHTACMAIFRPEPQVEE
jgi:small ligand-binding sensory domain FIST